MADQLDSFIPTHADAGPFGRSAVPGVLPRSPEIPLVSPWFPKGHLGSHGTHCAPGSGLVGLPVRFIAVPPQLARVRLAGHTQRVDEEGKEGRRKERRGISDFGSYQSYPNYISRPLQPAVSSFDAMASQRAQQQSPAEAPLPETSPSRRGNDPRQYLRPNTLNEGEGTARGGPLRERGMRRRASRTPSSRPDSGRQDRRRSKQRRPRSQPSSRFSPSGTPRRQRSPLAYRRGYRDVSRRGRGRSPDRRSFRSRGSGKSRISVSDSPLARRQRAGEADEPDRSPTPGRLPGREVAPERAQIAEASTSAAPGAKTHDFLPRPNLDQGERGGGRSGAPQVMTAALASSGGANIRQAVVAAPKAAASTRVDISGTLRDTWRFPSLDVPFVKPPSSSVG